MEDSTEKEKYTPQIGFTSLDNLTTEKLYATMGSLYWPTDLIIKEDSNKTSLKGKATSSLPITRHSIKDNGKIINRMEKEYNPTKIKANM